MAVTIYYLSATGNSLHVAKKIAEVIGCQEEVRLISVTEALATEDFSPEGCVGFVMPLHFFALPLLAEEFLSKVDLQKSTYVFGIVTAGFHYIGDACRELKELVSHAGAQLAAFFYVDMVSVYLPLSDLPSPRKTQKKLASADQKVREIAQKVLRREPAAALELFSFPSKVMHQMVQKQQEKLDQDFYATDSCVHCGLCAQICPKKNIMLEAGKPCWHHDCTQCLACLHICPQQCIELGSHTKGRRRYHHPDIAVSELFPPWSKKEKTI